MNNVLELFERLTNIKANKYELIKEGITNINYLIHSSDGLFVMRIPRSNMIGIDYINQGKVLKLVKELNVEVIFYDDSTGIMITRYLNNITKEKVSFDVVVKHLKKLHSISCTDISDFDPFKLIKTYKSIVNDDLFKDEEKVILKAKEIQFKPLFEKRIPLKKFDYIVDNHKLTIKYDNQSIKINKLNNDILDFGERNVLGYLENDETMQRCFIFSEDIVYSFHQYIGNKERANPKVAKFQEECENQGFVFGARHRS